MATVWGSPPLGRVRGIRAFHPWKSPDPCGCGTLTPKRLLDIGVAVVGLSLGLPIFCLVAAAIYLESPGPVFYTQTRAGYRMRPFRMYKFRSMRVDAERDTGPVWATNADPRATRVGAWLRRTHLDETPQLLNVLRGEMSVVGPRPERPAIVEQLIASVPRYADRAAVLPGITGLAQVRNGYDCSLQTVRRKLRYDLHYIRRGGRPRFDLAIMTRTLVVMVRRARGTI